jgi:hypothetical protein
MTESNDTTTIPAARNNNLVAESDLTSALQALEQRFEDKIAAAAAASDGASDDYDSANLEHQQQQQQLQLQQLLKDCQNSLSTNIQRIVQPVSDEAFHTYVYQQQQTTNNNNDEHADENNSSNNNNSKESSLSNISSTSKQEQPVWDEDDLMDPLAHERVQELRRQVRSEAQKVQTQQQAVLAKAVAVAERQVQLLVRTNRNENKRKEGNQLAGGGSQNEVPPESVAKIQEMQTCLTTMMTALQQTEQDLPDKLTSLQDTVATIEASFAKPVLSQTEQAIRAREPSSNSGAGGFHAATSQTMEPATRLANFLRSD